MRFERTERRRTPNRDGESPGNAGSRSEGDSQSKADRAAAKRDKAAIEIKRSAEMAEVPKLEAEMASEQSNGKPYGEKSKDPEIPDGEIRAAVNPELSEQQGSNWCRKESAKESRISSGSCEVQRRKI